MADTFIVKANSEYKYEFLSNNNDGKVWRLYSVTLWDPINGVFEPPILVLADDRQGAISQATCSTRLGRYSREGEVTAEQSQVVEARSRVEEVPFRIRGWGSETF